MGEHSKVLNFILILCLVLSVFSSGVAYASSENWSEVTRFTGESGFIITEQFTCDDSWRVRWEFETVSEDFSDFGVSLFKFYVYENESEELIFESESSWWTKTTSGSAHISKNGTFFIHILSTVESYTVIIEQNLDSIPEFPSWTILPLFLTATVLALVVRRRIKRNSGL